MKNCSLEYRTVFESHSQLKLKSGATYCINPELKPRMCPIFPALLGCGDVPRQLQNKVKQKTFPLTSNLREHEHVFWAFSTETISPFVKRGNSQHVWCPMNRTNTNVKTSAASSQEYDIYLLLKPPPSLCTSGRSCLHFQNNRSCENIFKHLPGAHETKCLPSLDGCWSALSCLPVLPSRNESTNWQWSSPKPDWSPMLWNLPAR